jgi:uncharacterized protein YpbB
MPVIRVNAALEWIKIHFNYENSHNGNKSLKRAKKNILALIDKA